ncbi:MAG: leucine-rich repeat domain-containing protein [Muribaculaceae bacterium]|nr:leucine-rich repeat domain-containing protein [Muribaculaceae bacterium]
MIRIKAKLTLALLAMGLLTARAEQVENVAGTLADRVEDLAVTQLTVTGTVDARDFKFMGQQLTALQQLDLSGATIEALETVAPVLGTSSSYAAGEVPPMAFFGHTALNEMTLPETVTSIGEGAFAGCSLLATINGLENVTSYGDYALSASSITSLDLPATVTTMGTGVAARCAALTTATVAAPALGEAAFKDCTSLSSVTLAPSVETLGAEAFAGDAALTSVEFPQGTALTVIGEKAFMGSGVESINLQDCDNLKTVGMWALANTPVQSVVLPQGVQEVGTGAFFYDTQLQQVSLPEGISSIGDFLLAGDNSVVVDEAEFLPEGITTVGDYALYNWDQLTSVIVPSSVNYIGTKAMAGMTGLTTVSAKPETVPELGDSVWAGVDQPSIPLKVSKSAADSYRAADQWKEFRIETIKTAVEELAANEANVKAYFDATMLVVAASEPIASLEVYALNGVLLNSLSNAGLTATVDTVNFGGNVYMVNVVLESGAKKVFKLAR